MSQYKKTILTQAGIDLAKRANAGTTKFKITRVVTSADDLSEKSIEELEKITEIPNIMQVGKITDAEEVESDNSVIGVGLRFTNRGLTNGYKIRIIGLYVQEEGQTDDFLYALTTAIEPEFMPDFNDSVLYRFNMQMYVVVGRTQSVNVVISDDTVVSIKKFNQLKQDNDRALKELNDHKADKIDTYSKTDINELLKTKDDVSDVDQKLKAIDFGKIGIKENHLHVNTSEDSSDSQFNVAQRTIFPVKQSDGNWIFDRASDDVTAETVKEALEQVLQNGKTLNRLGDQFNTKVDKDDVDKALKSIDFGKIGIKGKYLADVNGTLKDKIWYPAKQTDGSWTFNIYDDDHTAEVASNALRKAESNEGGINQLNARFDKYAGNQVAKIADANAITTSGTYLVESPENNFPDEHWGVLVVHQAIENGDIRLEQIFYPDDNSLPWFRMRVDSDWKSWHQLASKEDINDLLNKLNQQSKQIQSLTTQLNNAKNEIDYIKQNYVEGKRFASNQEAQAKAWENQNPQRVAFISD